MRNTSCCGGRELVCAKALVFIDIGMSKRSKGNEETARFIGHS
jgi:hypothetical protein